VSTNGKRARNSVPLAAASSRDAKRTAAAILEVLAGLRSPPQAAEALGVSLPRYYQLEARGLTGLLEASEPRPRGRQSDPSKELAALQKENERLRQEVGRQQTLVRAAQRTVGLGPAPPPAAKPAGKKGRSRRPVVRALNLAARLKQEAEQEDAGDVNSSATP
jgi:hypothetical protein